MSAGTPSRRSEAARWLTLALALHGAVALLGAALSGHGRPRSAPPTSRVVDGAMTAHQQLLLAEAEVAIDLSDDSTLFEQAPAARRDDASPRAPSEAAPGALSSSARAASADSSLGGTGVEGAQVTPSSDTELPAAGADSPGANAPGVAAAEPTALSLDQLGIGASNPFVVPAHEPLSDGDRARQRLQASLRQGSQQQQRRLGPEAPVVEAARRVLLASELIDASAVVDVRIDGAGRVTSVDILEASGHSELWRRLGERLLAAAAPLTLRFTDPSQGRSVKLRLTSAMRLPSGAAPGLRTDLLGLPLSDGKGPSSSSLSLAPAAPLPRDEVFDSAGSHRDQPLKLEAGLLTLKGDIADTTARARRVVEVAMLSVDVSDAAAP